MKFIWLFIILLLTLINDIDCWTAHHERNQQQGSAEARNQQKPEAATKVQQRPDEIVFFVSNARSTPADFAADLLIRIAESNKIADLTWKRELLEEAFRIAPNAQQRFKRNYASWQPIDTRAGYLAYALDLKLDTLSLQCRAVRAMLSVDKQKAREMFGEIPRLDLKPIGCEESLVYDVFDFYTTLTKIAQIAFSPKEIRRNKHVRFVESYIDDLVSPTQIGPIADTILAMNISPRELETLLHTFNSALQKISGDDRAFWFSYRPAMQGVNKLLAACQEKGISTEELLRAYRTHLVKQFSSSRCADPYSWFRDSESRLIEAFNNNMRLKSQKNILPILADDMKPSKINGEEKVYLYWQSPKAAELLTKIKKLGFGSGDKPLTDAEREPAEWRADVDDFLKDMAAWRKEDEKSEEDYFHQKCNFYVGLLKLMPPSPTREDVLRKYISFLNEFDLQRGSRIEWFWQAEYLIKGALSLPAERRSKFLETIGIIRNPILHLYIELAKISQSEHNKSLGLRRGNSPTQVLQINRKHKRIPYDKSA